jgi:hypothetical protein
MRRPLLALLAPVLLSALVAACAAEPVPQGQGSPPGSGGAEQPGPAASALDFTADTVGGGQLDASSLEGRDVVLWFWAPW